MKLFLQWLVATIAILIAAYVVPGAMVTVVGALVLAIVLGILNLLLKPIINVLTLGLFSLVINALLVMLAAAIVPGFAIAGFWSALLFSIVLTLVNWVFHLWSEA